MATATMMTSDPKKQPRPGKGGYQAHNLTEEEARVRAIAEIVNSMVELSRKNQTVDLNAIKSAASQFKFKCECTTTMQSVFFEIVEAYNPYVQARGRIDQLKRLGHSVDKVEFILMGGTFMSLPADYRDYFIRNLHDALSGHTSANVEEAVSYSEHGATKCIGMTIETPEEVELVRRDYMANEGWETFLSYEDIRQDILVGLLRLRKCGRNVTCPELTGKCSIVRELHVYGTAVPVHGRDADKLQHQGYGMLLMEEAERIASREHRSTKIGVISGVGTRHYYRKLGYELEGPYMLVRIYCMYNIKVFMVDGEQVESKWLVAEMMAFGQVVYETSR
ncbi:hypothetical protein ACFE04_019380 [Oxalis oulophora]